MAVKLKTFGLTIFCIFIYGCSVEDNVVDSSIIEITSFSEADFSALDSETLIVFDIDGVLTIPNASTGMYLENREKWGNIINEYKVKHPHFSQNTDYYFSILYKHQEEMVLEPIIYDILRNLKNKNISTIACSTWPNGPMGSIQNMSAQRYTVLKDLGIKFDWSYLKIKLDLVSDLKDKKPVFSNGIICTDGVRKGVALLSLFAQTKYYPKTIVFFDDHLEKIKDVQDMCHKNKIKFYGYHYKKPISSKWNEDLVRFKIENLIQKETWFKNDEEALCHFKNQK